MRIKKITLTLFILSLLSCVTQIKSVTETENINDLLIVDCLLPGQVRALGQIATYITARRAIKATAVECGVRGGEYVAYDRANYLTALNIWMPKAETGEAEAQNYVGEIYEKGLGRSPDFEMAFLWYKKAANQGSSKAQMNLGYLYEKGLGVQQNKSKAMEWYAKSSNFSKLKLDYATTISTGSGASQMSSEVKLLKAALKNSQLESEGLRSKLVNVRTLLSSSKSDLIILQEDVTSVKKKIQQKNNIDQDQREVDALNELLREKAQKIDIQQNKIEMLELKYKKEAGFLAASLTTSQKRAQQMATELKKHNAEKKQSQVALLVVETKLAETEKNLLETNSLSNQRLLEQEAAHLKSQLVSDQAVKERYVQNIDIKAQQLKALRQKLASEKQRYESEIAALRKIAKAEQLVDKPSIEIIDPPFVLMRGLPTVTLRSIVKEREIVGKIKASAGLLSLSINDKKRDVNDQGLFKINIKLTDKETPVNVTAVDNNGDKASLNFVLSMGDAILRSKNDVTKQIVRVKGKNDWRELDFGRYYALIIGNNDYKKIPKLDTPETDAREIDRVLRNKYGFKTKLLLNGTRYQILSELNKLRAKLSEKDNLLIYYAGHGELDKVNMRGHWLPVDADADNTANWISTIAITDILNAMSVKHIMIVSDSCYSGAMTRSSLARLDAGVSSTQRVQWLKAMLKTRSRTVLTSGGLKPVMDGGGGQHSVFAKAFINALNTNDTLLEGQALYRNVSEGIVSIASKYGIDQVPEYAPIRHAGHESGEFFFVPAS